LKSLSTRITKAFDIVIKFAGEIVKHEDDAKEYAKKMEEASVKAQVARTNMITVFL
jgi:hypothetical protein